MPTSNHSSFFSHRHKTARRGTSVLGAVLLLVSCAGQPRSSEPSPVSMADEEAAPSADLASIVQNQIETTQELQALLDAQDPAAWSTTRATKAAGVIADEAISKREYPDAQPDAATDPNASDKPRAANPKTGAPKKHGTNTEVSAEAPAVSTPAPTTVPIDAAEQTRPSNSVSALTPAPSFPTESPSNVRGRLVSEIAGTLRQENQAAGGTAIEREGLALLALDVVQPGSVDAELATFALGLSPAEARSFESLKSLFRTLGDQATAGGSAAAVLDAARLQTTLSTHATQLADGQPLLISTASLCTSVDGYGRYTPFASTTFVQGRAHPTILYLSVDHVTQKEMAEADAVSDHSRSDKPSSSKTTLGTIKSAVNSVLDGPVTRAPKSSEDGVDWAIDLTQSAMLYHDKDNLPVFNFGEQTLRDTSRDKRRDFCIARRIEIPASISLGRYNLKVTVRDKAGNASAEAIIPIQIVADASLAK